jgi:hypothetical protein
MVAVGGFDMIVFSFGSGFDLESDDQTYIESVRNSIAYANSHGIEVRGVSAPACEPFYEAVGVFPPATPGHSLPLPATTKCHSTPSD